jgi:transposase-like protein
MGRRRKLTDEQVDAILAWHRNHKTRAELAQELGIAKHLVGSAIRRRGQYKGPSPENREQNLRERRARIARLNLRLVR